MQRRMHRALDSETPPKSPFIRPHISANPTANGLIPKKSLASTARIWALVIGFGLLFAITRLFSNQDAHSHSFYNQDALHPTNYLNQSSGSGPPFDFCPVHGPADMIGNKHGVHAIAKSRLHIGSGARIQRLIHRAMSGQPVVISVLGGSIASCHGAGDDPLSGSCWPARFFMWWNSVFPHPASQLTNGAKRRTDSSYFSFCHGHHLPDESDLVILDFDTEDETDKQALEHFELLVRSILNRKEAPAVLFLGHFSPQFQSAFGYHGPELQHSTVAQFYDVPHISIKGLMYSEYMDDPEEYRSNYHVDPVLANVRGHELLADVLISYFQSQICKGWDAAMGYAFDVPILSNDQPGIASDAKGLFGGIRAGKDGILNGADDDKKGIGKSSDANAALNNYNAFRVPSGRLGTRPWELDNFREAEPFCVAADDLINPLPPSLFYGSGWHVYHPQGGDDVTHYWYSIRPTSKLRVPLRVGAGDIAVYYLEEEKDPGASSAIECWVDDNYGGRVMLRNNGNSGTRAKLVMIDHGVSTGAHFVECQLIGDDDQTVEPFKLLGIFST